MTDRVQVKFDVTRADRNALRSALSARGLSVTEVLQAFVQRILKHGLEYGVNSPIDPAPQAMELRYSDGNREWHEKLEEILTSGDDAIIKAVLPNIEVFHERLIAPRKRPPGRRRAAVDE